MTCTGPRRAAPRATPNFARNGVFSDFFHRATATTRGQGLWAHSPYVRGRHIYGRPTHLAHLDADELRKCTVSGGSVGGADHPIRGTWQILGGTLHLSLSFVADRKARACDEKRVRPTCPYHLGDSASPPSRRAQTSRARSFFFTYKSLRYTTTGNGPSAGDTSSPMPGSNGRSPPAPI